MDRMLKQIQINLKRGDKCQDAAAFLSSKFLTRPETVKKLMPEFLDWAMQIISTESKDRIDDIGKLFVFLDKYLNFDVYFFYFNLIFQP